VDEKAGIGRIKMSAVIGLDFISPFFAGPLNPPEGDFYGIGFIIVFSL
jgi:hypothetical protein